ncbi:GntR family transcriptional regulator [uncultured Agathobaculum sp.]|uniref:GntR family transcriptional regulator n=1 Tax=uncultured Agathobaculum sp. TaxID=2048140 RepID=UPI00296FACB5
MDIILSNMDSTPIYEQITRQIKAKILGGELKPGEALPSMRLLAKELRISVITTKRAYEELEREGLITSQTGRGSFVAEVSGQRLREEQLRTVEEHLTNAIRAARLAGLTADELAELARTLFEEEGL